MINGLIIVRKEKGYTSNDVVQILRGILKQKKIGHTGTLDPDAEGVLPVCLGHGTKLVEMLTAQEKEYEAVMRLGLTTDTQDISGKVTGTDSSVVTEDMLSNAAAAFTGEYMQTPPMYSAVKIGGQKLYEIARKGKEIDRPARQVMIYSLELTGFAYPDASIRVCCSKGTYIRTLCHDIGQRLGCGACMTALVRTRSGRFTLDGALTLEEIKALVSDDTIMTHILSLEELLSEYPALKVQSETAHRMLRNGNKLLTAELIPNGHDEMLKDSQLVRIYDGDGILTAVYRYRKSDRSFKAYKMFI